MSYKRVVLLSILQDIYPNTPIACGTTYASIILYSTEPLVPEQTIIDKYPAYTQQHNLDVLRKVRQQRLAPTDFYGLSDYPFPSEENKQEWLNYRQALRNITNEYPNPETDENDNLIGITWPTPPSS